MKLVHLVGFIIKKSVTMYGHMNVKMCPQTLQKCQGLETLKPKFRNEKKLLHPLITFIEPF